MTQAPYKPPTLKEIAKNIPCPRLRMPHVRAAGKWVTVARLWLERLRDINNLLGGDSIEFTDDGSELLIHSGEFRAHINYSDYPPFIIEEIRKIAASRTNLR